MQAEFLLDYDVVTVEQEHTLYLMARLSAGPAPSDQIRRPLNLSLVIDRSGSMAGSKIDYTRQAAQLLVQNMSANDILSIVLYNEAVKTLLPPQNVQHKDLINQRINAIKATGTTNLSSGWLEGCNHVAKNQQPDLVNRVILMSDGLANRGIVDMAELVSLAEQKRNEGITTTTMGLGEDFNEDLLIAIADAGGGAFYFIESPEVTPTIFQEELNGLLSVIGQNLVIAIEYTNHVKEVRQLNAYPEQGGPNSKGFRLGDVFGEEVKTLMLELRIPALASMGSVQIATLRFEYDEINDGITQHQIMEMPVFVNVSPGALPAGTQGNREVSRSVLLLKAAEARREAVRLADQGKYERAADVLQSAADEIERNGLEDTSLDEEKNALITQARDMKRGADFYQSYSRKTMATQAYFTSRAKHEDTVALRLREKQRQENESDDELAEESVNRTGEMDFLPPPPPTRPKSASTPTHLVWRDRDYRLDKDLIRIGRAPQNEIVMDIAGVSRFHCQIKRENDKLLLEDLGSTNGTHVGGRILEEPYTLRDGDVIYLCDQRVVFEAR